MASIHKRNGKFQAQVRRSGIQSITKTFQTKSDAQAWARQIEASLDRGDLDQVKIRQYTLGDLIQRYAAEITPRKKQAPQEKYRLRWLLDHSIAKVRLDKFGPQHISLYRDERLAKIRVKCSDGSQAVRHDLTLVPVPRDCPVIHTLNSTNCRAISCPTQAEQCCSDHPPTSAGVQVSKVLGFAELGRGFIDSRTGTRCESGYENCPKEDIQKLLHNTPKALKRHLGGYQIGGLKTIGG